LSAYLDGELDAAAREQVESHLAACPICAVELESLR
jgi:anti-sigma factor RsiW